MRSLSCLWCACLQADSKGWALVTYSPCMTVVAEGGAAQSIDPVLEHLMHNARSDAVRQEFLRGDLAELIDHHEIRLLVRRWYGLGLQCIVKPHWQYLKEGCVSSDLLQHPAPVDLAADFHGAVRRLAHTMSMAASRL